MPEQRRNNQRPSKPRGGKPSERAGQPASRSGQGSKGQPAKGKGRPVRGDGPKGTGKPRSGGARRPDDRPDRGGRGRGDERRAPRQEPRIKVDAPEIPAEITGRELDRGVAAQLKGLPDHVAVDVARHLAAAGTYIEDDPERAYKHAMAARARAARLAVVREAAGEAAYAAGHFAEALAELRAAKRMNGATAYLPMMADCHRALGHPEQALKLAKSPGVANFSSEAKAEMTIVEAGARRDMGQLDAALRTLELAPINSKNRGAWVVRLRYAYADTLEAAGRLTEALTWFHRTHAIDGEELTDAAERAEALEKRLAD